MTCIAAHAAARIVTKAALALGMVVLFATAAAAVSPAVERACASDYLAYCSQHDPDGPGVRRCMRANGLKLSPTCISALVAAGEVSKAEVARRSARR